MVVTRPPEMQPLVVLSQSPGAALSRSQGPLLKLFLSAPQLLAVPGPSCLLSLLLHITHCSSLDISVKQYYNPKGNTLLSLPAPPNHQLFCQAPHLASPQHLITIITTKISQAPAGTSWKALSTDPVFVSVMRCCSTWAS